MSTRLLAVLAAIPLVLETCSSYMLFSDPDIAERAHKAFSRAVELCQKKKEAF